jgi:hypothetical protein
MRKLLWLARPAIEALSAQVSITGAVFWPIINILKIIGVDLVRLAESVPEAHEVSWAKSTEEKVWADFVECLNYRENHRGNPDADREMEDWFARVENCISD